MWSERAKAEFMAYRDMMGESALVQHILRTEQHCQEDEDARG